MKRTQAKELIERYIDAWLSQNVDRFLETLHDDVIVRECYGPIYEGVDSCTEWFRTWHSEGNRVQQWTIDSFLFDSDTNSAAIEWDFSCIADGEEHSFFGSSHIRFQDERISSVNEYEMTKNQYKCYTGSGQSRE